MHESIEQYYNEFCSNQTFGKLEPDGYVACGEYAFFVIFKESNESCFVEIKENKMMYCVCEDVREALNITLRYMNS